jgi:hypothetical protein
MYPSVAELVIYGVVICLVWHVLLAALIMLSKKKLAFDRRLVADPPKPVLISCHRNIEEQEGYETYLAAKAKGHRFIPCRYLGCADINYLDIDDLYVGRFEK